ncbi:TlpA family protein disulfide reductase [Azohydromonas lata]|uniref:TlpA disulfide reductase family protein n=1 Tax=Azohydromonas lata TaxID=45677 RepID=A0ABU5IKX4_9BURK|nr:TlpA disulfide reductase family protein [Azohydromonas lata]MDZ5459536.1 TlpA disulfide reductase family protein [Azohydromonas lata]
MTQVLQLGPLALSLGVLLTVAALAVGHQVGMRLGRRAGLDVERVLWRMLLVGLAVSRLAFVLQWRGAYLAEPLSILDIRDGGWEPGWGLAAACLHGLHAVRHQGALRRSVVATVLATGATLVAGHLALLWVARPAQPLPALALRSLDGATVPLASFGGRPTVINLWATWCPPCRREMPVLQQAQQAHPDLNFVFVNQGEAAQLIERYLRRQGLELRHVLVDERQQAGLALGRQALPTTFFFDAQGRLAGTRVGELSAATLARQLQQLRQASSLTGPTTP